MKVTTYPTAQRDYYINDSNLSPSLTLSMDAFLLYPLLFSSFSLLLYGVVRISYSIWWKPKWLERQLNQQGIRGTPYKLLVGDMTELLKQMKAALSKPIGLNHNIVARVYPFTMNNVQKYGKISMFWVGTTPTVIIKDPEMMKEVLSNKQGHFGKPPRALNTFILILTRGLATLEGETWTKRRRILNPAFQAQKLKGMVPEFSISCYLMMEQWKKMTSDNETGELDIWPELQKLTADIILRVAFGSSYEEGKKLFGLQKELITSVLESLQTIHIPGFRFLPTKKNRKRKWLVKEITSIMKDLIQRKQNAIRSGQSKADDLLSLLLQCTEENSMTQITNGTKGAEMTIEEVIEECKQFYLAGQETTASLITWTMIVLAMHPDWQQRAREEVLQVCGKKDIDFEAISHLKTVTMILYEVLRLYPPAIAINMHTYKKTKIGDISIPAGVDITLPTLLIHHDPELWGDDSEEFNPERFSEGVSKASKDQLAFFPFGWGPRTCIGLNFAMIEAKLTLAVILQHFSFGLSPSYTHAPYTVMTLQPQHGAQITLHQL